MEQYCSGGGEKLLALPIGFAPRKCFGTFFCACVEVEPFAILAFPIFCSSIFDPLQRRVLGV